MNGRVVVAGDWHGDLDAATAVITTAAAAGVREIWHQGDLGVGPWPGDDLTVQDQVSAVLGVHGCTLVLTPGNHENWDTISTAPLDELGRHVLAENVVALARGSRFTADGRACGSIGGAVSIDQNTRKPNLTWWADEPVTQTHVDQLGHQPLDILLTHDTPWSVPLDTAGLWFDADLVEPARACRKLLLHAVHNTAPALVFTGHWHQRVTHTLNPRTTVHVLDREHQPGNAVIIHLPTLAVEPLHVPTTGRTR